MALKKSQLYSSLWQSCDQLRGGMDASQYKDYILTLLFVKYISDKAASPGGTLLDVPEGGGFADMVAAKNKTDIGDRLNKVIGALAKANNLTDVINIADFNDPNKLGDGKAMQDRLTNLVGIFQGLDFRGNRADGDDLLGDAYEYLMRHFATESGKSKGQFYTPAEVSRVMAKLVGARFATSRSQTVYDPTCGSGSLLLKVATEAPHGISIYGQENDVATWALARMNMVMHGEETADLRRENTLSDPKLRNDGDGTLKTFDFVVANPPFSMKNWANGFDPDHDEFGRFAFGVPPAKNGDYAFLLHVITSLKSTGKGVVVMPHGVLFRGNAEADIRRNLLKRGLIQAIIGLPANLFYGTGIPACLVVIDKEHAAGRAGVFMVDASKGFAKDGPKNRLRAQDIHKIADAFVRQAELPCYSRFVPNAEIAANDFNLNIPRYIDGSEPEDLQDIEAHLKGGIPERDIDALSRYWEVFPAVRAALFRPADRPGYCELTVPAAEIKATIFNHPQFVEFTASIDALFARWRAETRPRLLAIASGDVAKELIGLISEGLLAIFREARLVDPYDVYQRLMDLWETSMQDDVYLIAHGGWVEAARPRVIVEAKDQKNKEEPDFAIGKQKFKADLIPPSLLVTRYFGAEQAELDDLEAKLSGLDGQIDELREEHGGEGGLLEEVIDNDKITKANVTKRLKAIFGTKDAEDERQALTRLTSLLDGQSEAKTQIKIKQAALEAKIAARYAALTEPKIKQLVVGDKWLASLDSDIHAELNRVSQALTGRARQLADRYMTTLPEVLSGVEYLSNRVHAHLRKMGALWN